MRFSSFCLLHNSFLRLAILLGLSVWLRLLFFFRCAVFHLPILSGSEFRCFWDLPLRTLGFRLVSHYTIGIWASQCATLVRFSFLRHSLGLRLAMHRTFGV